jgi:serine phosphatase RsbU (regulator of sigma subunit)/CHASE2 domain-containing sensor protein
MLGAGQTHNGQGSQQARYKLGVAACAVWLAAMAYRATPLERWLEERISLPLYFQARQSLGAAPPIDPRLKIFSFDDTTLSRLGRPHLRFKEWVTVLTALDQRRPRAIVIDQIFGLPPEHPGFEEHAASADVEEARRLVERLAQLRTPLLSAAFVSSKPLPRSELDLNRPPYLLQSYGGGGDPSFWKSPPLVVRSGARAFGPHEAIKAAFRQVGHVLNGGPGHAQALIALTPTTVLPHMALLGAKSLTIEHGEIHLDQTVVSTNSRGEMLVDYPNPRDYYKVSRRVFDLLRQAESGRSIDVVSSADIVLIIPASFTGHADFTETPVGWMPGGFVHAALLNSRLRGMWLDDHPAQAVLELAMAGLGALLYRGSILGAMGFLALGSVIWVGACLGIFVLRSELIGLSSSLFVFVATGLSAIALKGRMQEALKAIVRLLRAENVDMRSELSHAGEVARVMLPAKTPDWETVGIGMHHVALSGTSGDWYAFESSPSGRLLHFILCDITGHGVQAAIIVSTCRTVLSVMVQSDQAVIDELDFISRYATLLNHTLVRNGQGNHTTTLAALTFDWERQQLHVLCAAHPQPVLVAAGKAPVRVGNANDLLGLDERVVFRQVQYPFGPKDMLLVYTDGVHMPRKLSSLTSLLQDLAHHPPATLARQLALALSERRATATGAGAEDDSCLGVFIGGGHSRRVEDGTSSGDRSDAA